MCWLQGLIAIYVSFLFYLYSCRKSLKEGRLSLPFFKTSSHFREKLPGVCLFFFHENLTLKKLSILKRFCQTLFFPKKKKKKEVLGKKFLVLKVTRVKSNITEPCTLDSISLCLNHFPSAALTFPMLRSCTSRLWLLLTVTSRSSVLLPSTPG